MARMTKAEKAAEKLYHDLYSKHCSNVQFSVMDLGNVHRETMNAIKAGSEPDAAMIAARDKYRKN